MRARDAAEVVDQRQAQHDRDRPELAQLQRLDGLVRADEGAQATRVDAAVAVGYELERDVVDDRVAGRGAAKQAGELPTVGLGQVAPGRPYLLLDEIEIVAQPLRGWSDTKLAFVRDKAVGIEENALVLTELREQKIRPPLLINDVLRRELLRVPLELLEAEQFGAQRLIIAAGRGLDPVPAAAAPDSADGAEKAPATGVQANPSSLPLVNPRLHNDAQSSRAARRSGPPLLLLRRLEGVTCPTRHLFEVPLGWLAIAPVQGLLGPFPP